LEAIFKLEIKEVSEQGRFSGYASVYNVRDLQDDIVANGAFDNALKEKQNFPMLWQHDPHEPIGILSCRSDEKGLAVEGQLCLEVAKAREAYALLKMRPSPLQGMSIGYNVRENGAKWDHDVRVLHDLDLWEASLVTFPANPAATVDAVKEREAEADKNHRESQMKELLDWFDKQVEAWN
jgi:HK97 family phage prohead protease